MVDNTKKTIKSILNRNKDLKKSDLKILNSISKRFPFFIPSKVLSIVVAKKYESINYSKILKSAAVNAIDRSHLFYILNNDIINIDQKKSLIKDLEDMNLKTEISFLDWLSKTIPTPKNSNIKIINRDLNELNLEGIKAKKHNILRVKKKDYITETLAELYVKQGKYHEALKAYKVLCLKYPEKISLFADQIKFIRIQIRNQ